jgi:ADP-ribose pyrophosphatase
VTHIDTPETRTDQACPPPEWELISSRRVGSYSLFQVREDRVRVPRNGSEHTFHVAESPEGVTVLALTAAGELVLVQQFRNPLWGLTLETPSGVVDPGERPEDAALRELREETGFVAKRVRRLGTLTLNPSWQTTRVHVLLAEDARRRAEREQDSAEDIRIRCLPLAEVRERVRLGEIDSAVALAALNLMDLHGDLAP